MEDFLKAFGLTQSLECIDEIQETVQDDLGAVRVVLFGFSCDVKIFRYYTRIVRNKYVGAQDHIIVRIT